MDQVDCEDMPKLSESSAMARAKEGEKGSQTTLDPQKLSLLLEEPTETNRNVVGSYVLAEHVPDRDGDEAVESMLEDIFLS